MEIKYEKITLKTIETRIEELLKDETLQKLGIKKTALGKTTYGYDINMISIGQGKKELFIIGTTHGSEIIGPDFITQFIKNLPEEYDPNLIKLNIIPIQNPEGFDITTSNLLDINNLNKASKEYYLRYRTDALIYNALDSLNKLLNSSKNIIEELKTFVKTNKSWKQLEDPRAMPNIKILNQEIQNIQTIEQLIQIIKTLKEKIKPTNINDHFLHHFLTILNNGLIEYQLNSLPKLYQQMFSDKKICNLSIRSKKMKNDIIEAYHLNPIGSQIGHDATGTFINLNANQPLNPGIEVIKNNETRYAATTKSNVRNYFKGPIGIPCLDINNFEYAIENKILYRILKQSEQENKYLATILYHGTGGLIYYKPHPIDENYEEHLEYNTTIASLYNEGIEETTSDKYRMLDEASTTGYGDLLRRTFKGVLLIELSKMGGNPIGPYGDETNIEKTIKGNIRGLSKIIAYFNKKIKSKTK